MLCDKLPFCGDLSWQKKFSGSCAAIDRSRLSAYSGLEFSPATELDGRVHFIKPETYMNLSGKPVNQAAAFFKIKPDAILVVHDELELPPGTLSLKFGGGLGGHNGLRSMKDCLGTADFWRIRIGIGRPDNRLPGEGGPPGSGIGIADWVLSDFDALEREIANTVLETAATLLLSALTTDPKSLLPAWAKKKVFESS